MTKLRFILLSLCATVLFGVGVVATKAGYDLATQTDVSCGGRVMQPGEQCENFSSRGGSWFDDYDGQRRRNQETGIMSVTGGAVAFLASAFFVFGLGYARRSAGRSETEPGAGSSPPVNLARNKTFRVVTLVAVILAGSIYPVGMMLVSGESPWILSTIPITVGLVWLIARRNTKAQRRTDVVAPAAGEPPLPPHVELR